MATRLRLTHIDTACVLIELNGYNILTDPTLDNAGHWYYHGAGAFSQKTSSPTLPNEGLPKIDLVLLSHHQHQDNLDKKGTQLLTKIPLALSTRAAARKFKNVQGMNAWDFIEIKTPEVNGLRITATPAQHHPWWVPEFVSGKVIGFVIEWEDQKDGVLYISGDTVFFNGLGEVARRYQIDVGLFHVGSVQFRYLTGLGRYTMNGNDLLKAVHLLNPNTIIPVHHKGWSHFKEKESRLQKLTESNDVLKQRTLFLQPGIATVFSCHC